MTHVNIDIDPQLEHKINKLCTLTGINKADLINQALESYITEQFEPEPFTPEYEQKLEQLNNNLQSDQYISADEFFKNDKL